MTKTTTHLLGNAFEIPVEISREDPNKPAGTHAFPTKGSVLNGIWEVEPAKWDSISNEEIFVVLAGRGKLNFPSGEEVALEPGAIVHVSKGEPCHWTITETLRKIYLIDSAS